MLIKFLLVVDNEDVNRLYLVKNNINMVMTQVVFIHVNGIYSNHSNSIVLTL